MGKGEHHAVGLDPTGKRLHDGAAAQHRTPVAGVVGGRRSRSGQSSAGASTTLRAIKSPSAASQGKFSSSNYSSFKSSRRDTSRSVSSLSQSRAVARSVFTDHDLLPLISPTPLPPNHTFTAMGRSGTSDRVPPAANLW